MNGNQRRRYAIRAVAASGCAIVLVGCSATTTAKQRTPSSKAGGGTTAAPAAPDTSPLTIGITYLANSQAQASLGGGSQALTPKLITQAYVRAFNAKGGLGGRRITAVTYAFNSQDANYSTAASAACAKFTQDNHVSVVLDLAFGTTGGFAECLRKAGVYSVTTQSEGDATESQQNDLHANVVTSTIDRSYAAVLKYSAADGYLAPSDQLGIVLEDCPDNRRAYASTLSPLIAQLKLKPPKVERVACTTGFASAGAAATALSSALLAFRQAKVDRIMFVSYYESVLLLLFAPGAATQHFRPGYLLSSSAQPVVLMKSIPRSEWPGLRGVGNAPFNDTSNASPTAADTRCLDLARAGGAAAALDADRDLILAQCGPFLLLDTLLQKTRGHADAKGLAAAVAGLGTGFAAPGLVDGSTDFSGNRHDGPASVRAFGFRPACQCIEYTGPAQPMP